MNEPLPGDLVAGVWGVDEDGEPHTFRVAEIVAVSAEQLDIWLFGDVFSSPPGEVDVSRLRRVRLHEARGGLPIGVPREEFGTWGAVPVRRAPVTEH